MRNTPLPNLAALWTPASSFQWCKSRFKLAVSIFSSAIELSDLSGTVRPLPQLDCACNGASGTVPTLQMTTDDWRRSPVLRFRWVRRLSGHFEIHCCVVLRTPSCMAPPDYHSASLRGRAQVLPHCWEVFLEQLVTTVVISLAMCTDEDVRGSSWPVGACSAVYSMALDCPDLWHFRDSLQEPEQLATNACLGQTF
jgi:hypothetical protein